MTDHDMLAWRLRITPQQLTEHLDAMQNNVAHIRRELQREAAEERERLAWRNNVVKQATFEMQGTDEQLQRLREYFSKPRGSWIGRF